MTTEEEKISKVVNGLKTFQKHTISKAVDLILDEKGSKRVLIADEVGLGKTLIAKGVIARLTEHYKNDKKPEKKELKIVYICSNLSIASQNLEKLKIFDDDNVENTTEARLTMLALKKQNKNSFLNFIPLTPATSFDLKDGGGVRLERIILYFILLKNRDLKSVDINDKILSELLRLDVKKKNWDWDINEKTKQDFQQKSLNKEILNKYNKALINEIDLFKELKRACLNIKLNKDQDIHLRRLIGKLRKLLAQVSADTLKPDLVIMDEFQRFKNLIDSTEETEMKTLMDSFLNDNGTALLLLSATPYKLYSTAEELDNGEDHFKEFEEVIKFLIKDEDKYKDFKSEWDKYMDSFMDLKSGNKENIEKDKEAVENILRNIMCRTERILVSKDKNAMLNTKKVSTCEIIEEDIQAYIECDKVYQELQNLESRVNPPMEFYKSSPYLFSFMEHYKFKKLMKNNIDDRSLKRAIRKSSMNWIDEKDIDSYSKIPYNNAKFRNLLNDTFEKNSENLLWVPPSMPYYELRGPFENNYGFSKTLVFSSWEMVPRMMSTLISYEAERKTIGKLINNNKDIEEVKRGYFPRNKKRYPSRRLNFKSIDTKEKRSDDGFNRYDRPQTMSIMSLLYPCQVLSYMFDCNAILNNKITYDQIIEDIKEQLKNYIVKLEKYIVSDDRVDNGWYWAAPILLDKLEYEELLDYWVHNTQVLSEVSDDLEEIKNKRTIAFEEHIEYIKKGFNDPKKFKLGAMPDDLIDILAVMAIGAPGIIGLRSLLNIMNSDEEVCLRLILDKALLFADEIRNKFNSPEAISVVDLVYKRENEYWKEVLRYCADGNLQSVIDEYLYMLSDSYNLMDMDVNNRIDRAGNLLRDNISLKTATYRVDTMDSFLKGKTDKKLSMRTHYAVSFTNNKTDEKSQGRTDDMRVVFNSPFRPFVLSTTSIGQEGLDFHWYCRKIVHWNLPNNPVELEQREGRINRYKGLVIRQNIASKYNNIEHSQLTNIWDNMFEEGKKKEQENGDKSELIPYWYLEPDDSIFNLERIIPLYPYSKDTEALDRLLKILSVYRLSLGRARQEEFVKYILDNIPEDERDDINSLLMNLSPYYYNQNN
ncbi:MAG: DEAD/DEAH box helicase [Romboutsia sp.]